MRPAYALASSAALLAYAEMSGLAEDLRGRYLAAQLAGNAREALRLIVDEGLAKGLSPRDIELDVVASAQREIGRLWECNRISVADEHQATAISQLVLSHLYPSLERSSPVGKTIVLACVEGEYHDMSARIASDMLESAGFDVIFLGANVPTRGLIEKLRATNVDALALAVTMAFNLEAAHEALVEIRAALPDLPILVGGEALAAANVELGDLDGVIISRGSALDLIALAKQTLGVRP